MRNGLLQPAVATAMTNAMLALNDSLAQLDRICNNPLPFAYHAHLRMTVWLYLLFFPVGLPWLDCASNVLTGTGYSVSDR